MIDLSKIMSLFGGGGGPHSGPSSPPASPSGQDVGVLDRLLGRASDDNYDWSGSLKKLLTPEVLSSLSLAAGNYPTAEGYNPGMERQMLGIKKDFLARKEDKKKLNQTISYMRARGLDDYADMAEQNPAMTKIILGEALKSLKKGPRQTVVFGNRLIDKITGETIRELPLGEDVLGKKDLSSIYNTIYDDYISERGEYEELNNHYSNLVHDAALGNAMSDIAMVTSFSKMMDPGSVVTSSEGDKFEGIGGASEKVNLWIQSIFDGNEILTDQGRQWMIEIAKGRLDKATLDMEDLDERTQKRANMFGIDFFGVFGPRGRNRKVANAVLDIAPNANFSTPAHPGQTPAVPAQGVAELPEEVKRVGIPGVRIGNLSHI